MVFSTLKRMQKADSLVRVLTAFWDASWNVDSVSGALLIYNNIQWLLFVGDKTQVFWFGMTRFIFSKQPGGRFSRRTKFISNHKLTFMANQPTPP